MHYPRKVLNHLDSYDYIVKKGDYRPISIQSDFDLSDYTLILTLREMPSSNTVIFTKTKTTYSGAGDNPTKGRAFIEVTSNATIDDWSSIPVSNYFYHIEVTNNTTLGDKVTVQRGNVQVKANEKTPLIKGYL